MYLKDKNGRILLDETTELLLRTDDEFFSVQVDDDPVLGKNVLLVFNDQIIRHGQLQELLMDDHPQYLDIVRHKAVHTGEIETDLEELLVFKNPVLDIVATKPASPDEGDRYAMSHTASALERGKIVEYKDGAWKVFDKKIGNCVYNLDDDTPYFWTSAEKWEPISSSGPGPTPTGVILDDGTIPMEADWNINELDPLTEPTATGYTLKHLPYPSDFGDVATKAYTLGRAYKRTWAEPAVSAASGVIMASMALESSAINTSTDTWVTPQGLNIAPGSIITYVGLDDAGLRRFIITAKTKGLVYYNLTTNKFMEYNGTEWIDFLDALGYNAIEAESVPTVANQLLAFSDTTGRKAKGAVSSFTKGDLFVDYYANNKYMVKANSSVDYYAGIATCDGLFSYACPIHPHVGFVVNAIDSPETTEIGGGFFVHGTCDAPTGYGMDISGIYIGLKKKGTAAITTVLKFLQDEVARFSGAIYAGGSVNVPTGSTFNINGIPHTHPYAPVITWSAITSATSMVSNHGYVINYSGVSLTDRCECSLPTTAAVGEIVRIFSRGTHGWKILQNVGQYIKYGSYTSITGVTGFVQTPTDEPNSWIELMCVVENTMFQVISSDGHIEINSV